MCKTFQFISMVSLTFFLAIFVVFWGNGSPAYAQTENAPSGPTTQNCFSAAYHAATDCDRLASGATVVQGADLVRPEVPVTGAQQPNSTNCYSARFHAASDCDRLASGQ
jgi:hypothetical protein